MAAHQKPIAALLAVAVAWVAVAVPHAGQASVERIVSVVPSVTEMLFAMGAGDRVIGVSSFDRYPPDVETRARVGGLVDPDVERIIALAPDLVIVYGTQTDLKTQMSRAGIPIFAYEHADMAAIMSTIRTLGHRIGSPTAGEALAARLETEIEDVRARVAGRPPPRTLLVFGRDAETLRGIYVSGGVGFLHDMLTAAGGENVMRDVNRQSIQVTSELIIARAPEVILEIGVDTASTSGRNLGAWNALAAVPAVRSRRIYELRGDGMMNPGPRISQSVRRVAEVLHPEVFR